MATHSQPSPAAPPAARQAACGAERRESIDLSEPLTITLPSCPDLYPLTISKDAERLGLAVGLQPTARLLQDNRCHLASCPPEAMTRHTNHALRHSLPDKMPLSTSYGEGPERGRGLVLLALAVLVASQQRRQLDECAHAEAGRALVALGVFAMARVDARNIEMRPGGIADEVADDLRR